MSSAADASVAVGRTPALLSGLSENHTAVGATPSRVSFPRSGSGSPASPNWRKAASDCRVKRRVGAGLVLFASAAGRGMPRDAAAAVERRAERKFRASHVFEATKITVRSSGQSSSSALGREEEEEEPEESRIAFSYEPSEETLGELKKNEPAGRLVAGATSLLRSHVNQGIYSTQDGPLSGSRKAPSRRERREREALRPE